MLAQVGPQEAGIQACETANYLSKGRLRVNRLAVGTLICVRTGKGIYAELWLLGFESGNGRLLPAFTTWDQRP